MVAGYGAQGSHGRSVATEASKNAEEKVFCFRPNAPFTATTALESTRLSSHILQEIANTATVKKGQGMPFPSHCYEIECLAERFTYAKS